MNYEEQKDITVAGWYYVYPKYQIAFPEGKTAHDTILDFLIAKGELELEPTDLPKITSRMLRLHFPLYTIQPLRETVRVCKPAVIMSPTELSRLRNEKEAKAREFAKLEREAKRYKGDEIEL